MLTLLYGLDESSGASALVDPAAPDTVKDWIKGMKHGARIEQIWTTHHHTDHSNGNLDMVAVSSIYLKISIPNSAIQLFFKLNRRIHLPKYMAVQKTRSGFLD